MDVIALTNFVCSMLHGLGYGCRLCVNCRVNLIPISKEQGQMDMEKYSYILIYFIG